jgi:hypothetical protein
MRVLSVVALLAAPLLASAFSLRQQLRGAVAGVVQRMPASLPAMPASLLSLLRGLPVQSLMKELLPYYDFADCARSCVRKFVASNMASEGELDSCQADCATENITPQDFQNHMLNTIAEYKSTLEPSDYEYLVSVVGERLSDLSPESAFGWVPCPNGTNATVGNGTWFNGTWPCVVGGNGTSSNVTKYEPDFEPHPMNRHFETDPPDFYFEPHPMNRHFETNPPDFYFEPHPMNRHFETDPSDFHFEPHPMNRHFETNPPNFFPPNQHFETPPPGLSRPPRPGQASEGGKHFETNFVRVVRPPRG